MSAAFRYLSSYEKIKIGQNYSRHQLAELWGYAGVQALQRGVVTPRDDNKIICNYLALE